MSIVISFNNPIPFAFAGGFSQHLKGPARVIIRDHKGRHLKAHGDGRVEAVHGTTHHEVFEMHHVGGDKLAFRNHATGRWLCAEANLSVICNRDKAGEWERFHPHHHADGSVSFKTHHGRFLCSEDSGRVVGDRTSPGPWEHFRVHRVDGAAPAPVVVASAPVQQVVYQPAPQPQVVYQAPVNSVLIDRATYHTLDVTARLQQVVAGAGGRLFIPNGTDYNAFFGQDPAYGVPKKLTIIYRAGAAYGQQTLVYSERQQVQIDPVAPPVVQAPPPVQQIVYQQPAPVQQVVYQQPVQQVAFTPVQFTGPFINVFKTGHIRVALRDHKGRHLKAHFDGRIEAVHQLSSHEVFELHHHGNGCAFRNIATGKWLCAESNHIVVCNRDKQAEWERFHPQHHSNGSVSFRTHHGRYLCSEDSGRVVADRTAAGPWEHFYMQRLN